MTSVTPSEISKLIRKELNLSFRDAARIAGVNKSTIQRLEADICVPNWIAMQRYLDGAGYFVANGQLHKYDDKSTDLPSD